MTPDGGEAGTFELVLAPHTDRFDAEDDRWLAQVSNGRITTVPGQIREDVEIWYEDGRPATATKLQSLQGLAVDAKSGVFVSDALHRVRYVNPATGIVSTVA